MSGIHMGVGAMAIAFIGGLVSFFSPCVAPLVPGYISYVSSLAAGDETPTVVGRQGGSGVVLGRRRLGVTARASLLFVSGFSVAFIGVGILAGGFGSLLVAYKPVMETLAGIVMIFMGAFLLRLLPRSWMDLLLREGRIHTGPNALRGWGAAGPIVLGLLFAAGWTPCIGPVLAAIYAYVGAQGSGLGGALLLACYSLGLAVPFVGVGMGWGVAMRALGWTKRYGNTIAMVSGAILIVVGVVYLTGEISIFSSWAGQLPSPTFG